MKRVIDSESWLDDITDWEKLPTLNKEIGHCLEDLLKTNWNNTGADWRIAIRRELDRLDREDRS